MPISKGVAHLNTIDQQLELLFYYITEKTDISKKPDEIIEVIRKEYKQTFFEETRKPVNELDNYSFLYLLDTTNKKPIWEVNILEILLNFSEFEEGESFDDWKIVSEYYLYLQSAARKTYREMTAENFNVNYPKLFLIDTKCRIFIDSLRIKKFFHLSEIEYILMIEQEVKVVCKEVFLIDYYAESSKYSFRRQVG
ncbi:hypothetical protein IGI37_001365 [Enterococcus sp. AZ194]